MLHSDLEDHNGVKINGRPTELPEKATWGVLTVVPIILES